MEHIKTYREAAGLNQTELAQKLGVRPAAVSTMEMPGRYPEARRLPAIADALDCSIDDLFGRRSRKEESDRENVWQYPLPNTILPPEGGGSHGA